MIVPSIRQKSSTHFEPSSLGLQLVHCFRRSNDFYRIRQNTCEWLFRLGRGRKIFVKPLFGIVLPLETKFTFSCFQNSTLLLVKI